MQRFLPAIVFTILVPIAAWYGVTHRVPAPNPDPNHTHADFAVWVNGTELDFSDEQFMSGSSTDPEHKNVHHPYLHLHDGNGHVIHRHKPGLSLRDFLDSLQVGFSDDGMCYASFVPLEDGQECGDDPFRMFVNGTAVAFDPAYVFADSDHILITNAGTEEEVSAQLEAMTDDACLYSRTCPWRGDPPTENCIADPKVPCVIPVN